MGQTEINNEIISFINNEIGEIQSIEENCGAMWVTTAEGKVFSINILECEEDI
jgi:hypothetical protein